MKDKPIGICEAGGSARAVEAVKGEVVEVALPRKDFLQEKLSDLPVCSQEMRRKSSSAVVRCCC